ncbi:arsenic transporter [Paenibacillus pinisoli]|uniref:Arsenical pump membrane protein n=1 Tax=Paenibacillus pinisoli TaxID=1276110 RepID=A0A3A6PKJ0_9BACL|nr:arsenic transporter [Paenibacillus pinisoli]RJX38839.1 arsenic transporter [Paenibacillus pinisoli]
MLLALGIFAITITFVIWQPKGLNIGYSAAGGAIIALLLGVVTLQDVWDVTAIVWNATLALIGIMIISLLLDETGFFEWAALHVARLSGGSGKRLFVYIILLGAGVSIFFANDGAVLILTPIVLAMVRALRFDERMVLPFVMAGGFISDTASLPLVISNLVNILSADFFGIGFMEYASRMIVPTVFAVLSSLLVLYLFFRKSIPQSYENNDLKEPRDAIKDKRMFTLSWYVLALLLIAYLASEYIPVPISAMIGAAALVLLMAARKSEAVRTREVIWKAPWSIVIFSIGMYVVVYGLRNAGLTDQLGALFQWAADQGLFAATMVTGFCAAILSSVMNNLPTVMIDALAIDGVAAEGALREAMIYANIIGSDLGPKMTPIGSLATLLWLHVLSRKGMRITWGYYFKVGVILTLPVLFLTLLGLYLLLFSIY